MDPKMPPKQPNPADNNMPTKGTPDPQSTEANNVINQPPLDTILTAAPFEAIDSEIDGFASGGEPDMDVPTDTTTAGTESDLGDDSDPSASNTSYDEPL
jgi:hypothetical protein